MKNKVNNIYNDYLLVAIDFYNEGDNTHFVFLKNEVNEDMIEKLYNDYNRDYEKDSTVGMFEDYLKDKNVNFDKIKFYKM